MNLYSLIKRKRDGGILSGEEIAEFLDRYTRGDIPDYQVSALLMAIFYKGLNERELAVWTESMLRSGLVIDLSHLQGAKVDKHSTGGVGDKISLCLAPLVAACGIYVPMISGRGLGHTGGTLDKLESIPGFRTDVDLNTYQQVLAEAGLVLAGQTREICPADKKLYSLRDVTATVDSIPLIASSIMSKKLAEGIDALVLDVKVGSGAFMRTVEMARELASTMVGIGREMGKQVRAVLTDMNQPLGRAVGNALEAQEAIDILRGQGPDDVRIITVELGAQMLLLGGAADTLAGGRDRIEDAIADGSGLERLRQVVRLQGGDPRAVDDPARLPRASKQYDLPAGMGGIITAMDTEAVGLAAIDVGAGRLTIEDVIDPAAGIIIHRKIGDAVNSGDRLATIYYNDEARLEASVRRLTSAYRLGSESPAARPLIIEVIGDGPS